MKIRRYSWATHTKFFQVQSFSICHGVTPAAAILQKYMDMILQGIPKTHNSCRGLEKTYQATRTSSTANLGTHFTINQQV